RTRNVLAQQLVGEPCQSLVDLIGESHAAQVLPVARPHLGLLRHLADQADDESSLVDHPQIAEEFDFGLDVHPAGKKSIGLVAVNVATSLASNLNRRMRASSLLSNSGALSSLDTIRAARGLAAPAPTCRTLIPRGERRILHLRGADSVQRPRSRRKPAAGGRAD